jgi:hypothetical protein
VVEAFNALLAWIPNRCCRTYLEGVAKAQLIDWEVDMEGACQ